MGARSMQEGMDGLDEAGNALMDGIKVDRGGGHCVFSARGLCAKCPPQDSVRRQGI